MTSGHSSLEKIYLSLYSKGLRKGYCVRGELETEQRLQHIDPQLFRLQQRFFLVLLSCSMTDSKLPDFLSHPSYIIVWHPPASCGVTIRTQFNPATVKVVPWYLRPDAPVIYTGEFLIWQLGQVGGQYVTPFFLNFIETFFAEIIILKIIASIYFTFLKQLQISLTNCIIWRH